MEALLQRAARTPLFRQIVQHIRDQISSGELPPGSRLPPTRELAERLRVNRSTVVNAYAELAADGLVVARVGRGTVVADRTARSHGSAGSPAHASWQAYLDAGLLRPDAALLAQVQRVRERPGIISLAHGEVDRELYPHAALGAATQRVRWDELPLGYQVPKGLPELRTQVAARLRRQGVAIRADNVLILNGAQQGFHLIGACLLQPGDLVAFEQPSYFFTLGTFAAAGLRAAPVDMEPQGLAPAALDELLSRRRPRLLFAVPTFQNPTSACMPRERRHEVVRICAQHGVPIVEDDPYGEVYFDRTPPPPLKAFDRSGHVLYLGSCSKPVAPGLRVGWLAGPAPVIERLADAHQQMDHGSSVLPQAVLAEMMRDGSMDEHLERLRRELGRRRDALCEALRTECGDWLDFHPPAGGYHLWARLRAPSSSATVFRAAARAGVAVTPGSVYGAGGSGTGDGDRQACRALRLSFCHARPEQMREAARRLAMALRMTGRR